MQATSLDPGTILFEVEFTLTGSNGSSSHLNIGSALIPAEAYTDELITLEIANSSATIQVGQATSIDGDLAGYKVGPTLPNPFSEKTAIPFTLPTTENVEVFIYNSVGQRVWEYENVFGAGSHEIIWDIRLQSQSKLSAGVYHVLFIAGDYQTSLRLQIEK